jgi:hypothetical protein
VQLVGGIATIGGADGIVTAGSWMLDFAQHFFHKAKYIIATIKNSSYHCSWQRK